MLILSALQLLFALIALILFIRIAFVFYFDEKWGRSRFTHGQLIEKHLDKKIFYVKNEVENTIFEIEIEELNDYFAYSVGDFVPITIITGYFKPKKTYAKFRYVKKG